MHRSHLVIQRQVAERRDVLGPFHQDQQLLLHGLAHVCDGGDLFGSDVAVQYRSGRGDLEDMRGRLSAAVVEPTDECMHHPVWLVSN